jgi:hypothetical protein
MRIVLAFSFLEKLHITYMFARVPRKSNMKVGGLPKEAPATCRESWTSDLSTRNTTFDARKTKCAELLIRARQLVVILSAHSLY